MCFARGIMCVWAHCCNPTLGAVASSAFGRELHQCPGLVQLNAASETGPDVRIGSLPVRRSGFHCTPWFGVHVLLISALITFNWTVECQGAGTNWNANHLSIAMENRITANASSIEGRTVVYHLIVHDDGSFAIMGNSVQIVPWKVLPHFRSRHNQIWIIAIGESTAGCNKNACHSRITKHWFKSVILALNELGLFRPTFNDYGALSYVDIGIERVHSHKWD